MFLHVVTVERITPSGDAHPVSLHQLDSFAMRNFTNDAIFDDTLPVADGQLEIGSLVPIGRLQAHMEQWFRRKLYLLPDESLRITQKAATQSPGCVEL